MSDLNERGPDGLLTPWALACNALVNNGCDCGTDEPGTCVGCLCDAAMKAERARAEAAEKQRDAARAVLRSVEWSADEHCPACSAWKGITYPGGGHAPTCALAAALGGTK